mmetsp:Transcript_15931/g.38576  ORF Transcript_15931/g.38576 Transcript_15931/m.38576 type:complete len:322 (-) Transcript_15931:138-1103(-)
MVSVIQFVSDKTWALSLSTPLATPSQDMLREVLREHARKLKLDRWELSMAQFTMTGVGPSRWAITGEDLDTLETLARKAFKFVQPDVHMLNKWIIAPHTFLRGRLSWAVLHNLETHGLKCQTFVSHCWDEPFYEFLQALRDQYADYARRAFWVCFVANPQSWGKAALDEMLQEYVPFWTAVAECSNVLIVRNRITHIYTRGWCVLELVAAVFHRRTITVVGDPGLDSVWVLDSAIGHGATCTNESDTKFVQQIVSDVVAEWGIRLNDLIKPIMGAESGTTFHPSQFGNLLPAMTPQQRQAIQRKVYRCQASSQDSSSDEFS